LDKFQLYNLSTDLAEQIDLKDQEPAKLQEMLEEWEKFTTRVGIIIPTPTDQNDD
jgi:arylsulfatase